MRFLWLLSLLVLAACGDTDTTDPAFSSDAAASDTADDPAAASSGGADCLLGTWAVDAAHSFRPETWDTLMQGNDDFSFEFADATGRALLTFERGGAAHQTFDDFSVTIDADTPAGAMSTTLQLEGTADSSYRLEGDQLLFEPGEADLATRVIANLGGREISNMDMDFESLFETGERGATTFDCRGDELLLDIHAPESSGGEVMFRDARYTRAS